ncbi:MAG: non-heme iron oxygenase ferredoxin subunit [Actinomycetota bacterium]
MNFEPVTQKVELAEGEISAFEVGETWLAVAIVDGEVYAVDDLCTHKGCSLAKGTLEGTTITCSCHGSQFDMTTGAVVKGPADKPLQSYRTRVERGVIQAEI